MAQRNADATGQLKDTPFAELLVYALGQRLEGSLVVQPSPEQRHALRFSEGEPVAVHLDGPEASELSAAVRQDPGAALRAHAPHCVVLGRLPLRAQSRVAEQVELLLKLVYVSQAPSESAFGYFAGADLVPGAPESVRLDPLLAIAHAFVDARANLGAARLESHCRRLANRQLSLHPNACPLRFGLGGTSGALVDVLTARPQTLADLEATGLCGREHVRRVVCMLALCRHLDVGQPPLGVPPEAGAVPSSRRAGGKVAPTSLRASSGVGLGASGSLPPSSRLARKLRVQPPSSSAGLHDELQRRFAALDEDSYYEILGVPEGAESAELADAFSRLARRIHPDRLPGSLGSLRPVATRVFARISEAHTVLTDPVRRAAYDQSLAAQEPTQGQQQDEGEQVRAIMRAASEFQKAEVLVRKKDWAGALRLARQAALLDAEQPEYVALATWLEAKRLPPEANWEPLIHELDAAVARSPNSARIRYFRACVLKSSGNLERAMQDFRFVLDREPHHLDAARELRLYEMRQQRAASSGLLGRWFGRD